MFPASHNCASLTRFREADILRLLQKLVTCNGAPVQNMQRRVLVSKERCSSIGPGPHLHQCWLMTREQRSIGPQAGAGCTMRSNYGEPDTMLATFMSGSLLRERGF